MLWLLLRPGPLVATMLFVAALIGTPWALGIGIRKGRPKTGLFLGALLGLAGVLIMLLPLVPPTPRARLRARARKVGFEDAVSSHLDRVDDDSAE